MRTAAISASSKTLTGAGATDFSLAEPGVAVTVLGAGSAGSALNTTIAAKVSAQTVTLADAAGTTVSAGPCAVRMGRDGAAAGPDQRRSDRSAGRKKLPLRSPHRSHRGIQQWRRSWPDPQQVRAQHKNDAPSRAKRPTHQRPRGYASRDHQRPQPGSRKEFQTVAAPIIRLGDKAAGESGTESAWHLESLLIGNGRGDGVEFGRGHRGNNLYDI